MERRSLEFFRAVANTGSVSGAAEAMSVTQPAVSKQINALEKSLGLKLFHRTTHGMTLTAAGKELTILGGDVLTRFDRLEGAMKARFSARPSLRVAAPHTTASVLIAPFIADTNAPVSDLSIHSRTKLDSALEHEVDIAISTTKPPVNRAQRIITNLLIRVYANPDSMHSAFGNSTYADLEAIQDAALFTPQTGVHTVVRKELSRSTNTYNVKSVATGLIAQAFAANHHGFAIATETEAFKLEGRPAAFNNKVLFSPLYASWHAGHYAAQELEDLAQKFRNWMLTTPPWSGDAHLYNQLSIQDRATP